jgi:hypothetical protein
LRRNFNRVAIVRWGEYDGISDAIGIELANLGYNPSYFRFDLPAPIEVDVVFSFGPFGSFYRIPKQIAAVPADQRPAFIHWNTEEIPDIRLPPYFMKEVSEIRSWIGRYIEENELNGLSSNVRPFSTWINDRILKFRFMGDYLYMHQNGWIDLFADISEIHTNTEKKMGMQPLFAPWGATPSWYEDLDFERDIDVLWLGNRRNKRRSNFIDNLRLRLEEHGVQMLVIDNVENPFVYGDERTQILNRTKIFLHLMTRWCDNTFAFRFPLAASNKSLVVSEPFLKHIPVCESGVHYVSAPVETMAETILYYINNEKERMQIVEKAHALATTQLTLKNSLAKIMDSIQSKNGQEPST